MKTLLLLFTALASTGLLHAQTPVLTADFNAAGDSDPRLLTAFNSKLFYWANDGSHGTELCSLSAAGTPVLAYDIVAGSSGSSGGLVFGRHMAVFGGKMYFAAKTGGTTTPSQVFVFDGTNPPALAPGMSAAGAPTGVSSFAQLSGKLYFRGGAALYSYDGINAPVVVRGTASLNPDELTPYNGRIYFSGKGATATEVNVYAYDPVTDSCYTMFVPGGSGSSSAVYVPGGYTVAGGKLFFGAWTTAYGWELYACDGTTVSRITDLTPGKGNGARGGMAALNNTLVFGGSTDSTNYQLYKYDVAMGTVSLAQTINPTGNARVNNLVACNGKVYFSASTAAAGNEPWVWDGTSATMVADLNPGAANSYPSEFYGFDHCVYFNASNGVSGNELFRIGTPTGVEQVSFGGQVRLYPNPAGPDATLELELQQPRMLCILLCDVTGKCVWTSGAQSYGAGKSGIHLPLGTLSAGTYFYSVCGSDGLRLAGGSLVKE